MPPPPPPMLLLLRHSLPFRSPSPPPSLSLSSSPPPRTPPSRTIPPPVRSMCPAPGTVGGRRVSRVHRTGVVDSHRWNRHSRRCNRWRNLHPPLETRPVGGRRRREDGPRR